MKKLCERSQWTVSNLEAQKHLFLAQRDFMRDHDGRLIDVKFEAWDHGPVIPELYHFLKRFGADPIENIMHSVRFSPSIFDRKLFDAYAKYRKKKPWELVALTHKPGGAWSRNFKSGVMGIVIPDSDIRKEARS